MPRTLTSASKSGSLTERLTSIWAAWCQSAWGPKSLKIWSHVLAPARREIVDDGNLVTATEQIFCHVRADKPGSPG